MELWIRSQDKMKLFRCIDFRGVVEQEGCSIIDNTDDYIIGTYKSIERALEVLNEIQNKIALLNATNVITDKDSLIAFHETFGDNYLNELCQPYQMPKE